MELSYILYFFLPIVLCGCSVCSLDSSNVKSFQMKPKVRDILKRFNAEGFVEQYNSLQNSRDFPINIAHRGGGGMMPEETIPAYKLAIEQGADYIECDVCVTKDHHLVCLHDPWMSSVTNVADIFPKSRKRKHNVTSFDFRTDFNFTKKIGAAYNSTEGTITDYFTVDFTLAEIKELRIRQRTTDRDPSFNYLYKVATLQECIEVAQLADRTVGIYPETKHPDWVNSLPFMRDSNTTFENLIVDVLSTHGYKEKDDPCFLQSFSVNSLKSLNGKTNLPKIMLLNSAVDDTTLMALSQFCYGVGPSRNDIVEVLSPVKHIKKINDFILRAHKHGLKVHPYTFENEFSNMPYDYGMDPYMEYDLFTALGADGIFTDFPWSYSQYLLTKREAECSSLDSETLYFKPANEAGYKQTP